MQMQDKIYCHWDLVRFISEKDLKKDDDTFFTLSVAHGNKFELMIFLGKDDSNSCWEVKIYKGEPTDKYVPYEHDHVIRYEENDEYATFFFDEFDNARTFTEMIQYLHPEFKVRPVKEITGEN